MSHCFTLFISTALITEGGFPLVKIVKNESFNRVMTAILEYIDLKCDITHVHNLGSSTTNPLKFLSFIHQ